MRVTYKELSDGLGHIKHIKTKDVDCYNKRLIAARADVGSLRAHVMANPFVHRTYFQVSLALLETSKEQLDFIEQNADLLRDWWHVDQLPQFLKKPLDFSLVLERAKRYINSDNLFLRRWGYVVFLAGLQKDSSHVQEILSLIKDDEAYYVQMAEAWLLCELSVFHHEAVFRFIGESKIKYQILGKAIQKIQDSYRIGLAEKQAFKSLREKLKKNG